MYETQLLAEAGVSVTTARFVVGHQTYPIANITSVAPFTVPASRLNSYLAALMFFLFAVGSVGFAAVNASAFAGFWALVWLVLTGVAIWVGVSKRDMHGVVIATAGLQVRALQHPDFQLVSRVVGALNHAIASR